MNPHRNELLTPREVQAELKTGRTHTYFLLKSGRIPSIKVSPRVVRVLRSDLEDWKQAERKAGEEAGE